MDRFFFFASTTFVLMGLQLITVALVINAPAIANNQDPAIPAWAIWLVSALTAMYVTFAVNYAKKEWT